MRGQEGGLRSVFHTFGTHLHAKVVGQHHDRRTDGGIVGIAVDVLDERAVDLDEVDRQALQIRQARIPRTEIVDGNAHAQLSNGREVFDGALGAFHQHRLGHFQFKEARPEAVLAL